MSGEARAQHRHAVTNQRQVPLPAITHSPFTGKIILILVTTTIYYQHIRLRPRACGGSWLRCQNPGASRIIFTCIWNASAGVTITISVNIYSRTRHTLLRSFITFLYKGLVMTHIRCRN